MSLLSRCVNQLYKKSQGKFRGKRRENGRSESTSGSKKAGAGKELMCFEYKDSSHFKNECTKLKKERPKKKFRGNKKSLMAAWDDSKSSEDDSEEEKANVALMACTNALGKTIQSESESESNFEEVFSELSYSKLESSLSEVLEKYQNLLAKYKDMKKIHVSKSEAYYKLQKDF